MDIKVNDTFTPPPDSSIRSLKYQRRTRVAIGEGTKLCACGAELNDVFNDSCQRCGRLSVTTLGKYYQAEALIIKQESWMRQFMLSLRSHVKTTMNQLQFVSRMVSKEKGPTATLALTNFPHGTELPSIEQAIFLVSMQHMVYNLAHYYQTMTRAERIACATQGIVEHYCNNRHITKAYYYVDNTSSSYDERLGNAIRYADLHPQAQGHNFIPVVEKVVRGPMYDLGLAERAFGVKALGAFDPVLIHDAPRGNTDKRRGGPVGPYAIGANTPKHEYPATKIPHNKDIRCATYDEVTHYLTVKGRNVTYLTMPTWLNSFKRIAYNEGKATIWETDWIRHVLNQLYDSFSMVNNNIPTLRRYNEIKHDRNRRA